MVINNNESLWSMTHLKGDKLTFLSEEKVLRNIKSKTSPLVNSIVRYRFCQRQIISLPQSSILGLVTFVVLGFVCGLMIALGLSTEPRGPKCQYGLKRN